MVAALREGGGWYLRDPDETRTPVEEESLVSALRIKLVPLEVHG